MPDSIHPASGGGGGAAPVPPREEANMGIYKVSAGKVRVNEETQKKANDCFMTMKEAVFEKLTTDEYYAGFMRDQSMQTIKISVNMSSGYIKVYKEGEEGPIEIDATSLGSADGQSEIDSRLIHTIKRMQEVLYEQGIMDDLSLDVVVRDFSYERRYFVGNPAGNDAFQRYCKRLKPHEARVLKEVDETLLDQLTGVEEAGVLELLHTRASVAGLKTNWFLKKVMDRVKQLKTPLETALEEEEDVEERKQIEAKIQEIDAQYKSLEVVTEMGNVLELVSQLSVLQTSEESQALPPFERADRVNDLVLAYFEKTKSMGSVVTNPDTGLPETQFTRRHTDLARVIAASACFNYNDLSAADQPLAYRRIHKREFQEYLEGHHLHPSKVHLGKIGVIQRLLQTSIVERAENEAVIKGRNSDRREELDANLLSLFDVSKIFADNRDPEGVSFMHDLEELHRRIGADPNDFLDMYGAEIEAERVRAQVEPEGARGGAVERAVQQVGGHDDEDLEVMQAQRRRRAAAAAVDREEEDAASRAGVRNRANRVNPAGIERENPLHEVGGEENDIEPLPPRLQRIRNLQRRSTRRD